MFVYEYFNTYKLEYNHSNAQTLKEAKKNSYFSPREESKSDISLFSIKQNMPCVYIDIDVRKQLSEEKTNILKTFLSETFNKAFIEESPFNGFHIIVFLNDWISRNVTRKKIYSSDVFYVESFFSSEDLNSRCLSVDKYKVEFNGTTYRCKPFNMSFEGFLNKQIDSVLVLSKKEFNEKCAKLIGELSNLN